MDMGDQDIGDVLRLHADAGETVAQLAAETRPEQRAGTGVDENAPVAGTKQIDVDGCFDRIGEEGTVEEAIDLGLRCPGQELVQVLRDSPV